MKSCLDRGRNGLVMRLVRTAVLVVAAVLASQLSHAASNVSAQRLQFDKDAARAQVINISMATETLQASSAPPLDLAGLETRLRSTKAIGVMTKLSLKNQVDGLLDKFRAYYKRQSKTTLAELRHPYDMLLLKVLSLLQDSDPPLARDIIASREAIWGILSDPEKFNKSNLMAGDAT